MDITKEELGKMGLDELKGLYTMLGEVIVSKQKPSVKPKFKRRKGCLWLIVSNEEIHLQI